MRFIDLGGNEMCSVYIPLLIALEEEVFVKPVPPIETRWCAESMLDPPVRPLVTKIKEKDMTITIPITTELYLWIVLGHNALKGIHYTVNLGPMRRDLTDLMEQCPIQDLGELLDVLDYLGRPAVFNVVVQAFFKSYGCL